MNDTCLLEPLRIAFYGKLGGATLRDAHRHVRRLGGTPVSHEARDVDWIVLGEAELPLSDLTDDLPPWHRLRAAGGRLRILSETEFWQETGRADALPPTPLHTAAALARMLDVPLSVIRRWHRRGLLRPVRVIHKLAYYDFAQAVAARQLARLLQQGVSPRSIESQLRALARFVPQAAHSLDQLSLMVEQGQILVRLDDGWIDRRGQRHFDFELGGRTEDASDPSPPDPAPRQADDRPTTVEGWVARAEAMEDEGRVEAAIACYRAALARAPAPDPVLAFRLGELLHGAGDLGGARERFYMALEWDPDFVEARANLGCVLAELGQLERAADAFEEALATHPEYADAHFHLADVRERLGDRAAACAHMEQFLALVPRGPWADAVRARFAQWKGSEASP